MLSKHATALNFAGLAQNLATELHIIWSQSLQMRGVLEAAVCKGSDRLQKAAANLSFLRADELASTLDVSAPAF